MSSTNGAADCWRQWGFTRRTQPTIPNPTNHQPPQNQTSRATQPHGDQNRPTENQYPPAQGNGTPTTTTGSANTPTAQTNTQSQNNPPTLTHPDHTAAPAPNPVTNQPIKITQHHDSYLEPWGDQLQQPKPPNTIQICLQNFGGWPTSAKHQKNDNIRRFVNSAEVDVLLTTENNIAWHKLTAKNRLTKQTRGWWESLQVDTAYNTTDPHTAAYQPGGIGIFSINRMAHRVH